MFKHMICLFGFISMVYYLLGRANSSSLYRCDPRGLEARGGERKLAGLPVVCCWCCCCWCCCCRCCAGRCCAGCSAGAGSSAAAAAGAGWSAAAAAAAALGMLLLLLPPLGGLLLLLVLLLLPLLRWALQMLGVLQLLGGPAHRAQGGVEPRGGGSIRLI